MIDRSEGSGERPEEEQQILDWVAERKGQEWVEEHSGLILAQAQVIAKL